MQSDIRASGAAASGALCFHERPAGALFSLHSFIAPIALSLLLPPGLSLDISIPSIADAIADRLQTAREEFCDERTLRRWRLIGAVPRPKSAVPTATSGISASILASFCAFPKAVEPDLAPELEIVIDDVPGELGE